MWSFESCERFLYSCYTLPLPPASVELSEPVEASAIVLLFPTFYQTAPVPYRYVHTIPDILLSFPKVSALPFPVSVYLPPDNDPPAKDTRQAPWLPLYPYSAATLLDSPVPADD